LCGGDVTQKTLGWRVCENLMKISNGHIIFEKSYIFEVSILKNKNCCRPFFLCQMWLRSPKKTQNSDTRNLWSAPLIIICTPYDCISSNISYRRENKKHTKHKLNGLVELLHMHGKFSFLPCFLQVCCYAVRTISLTW